MKIYVVVKTARKDVTDFPSHFSRPHQPAICLVDSYAGRSSTLDRKKAEEVANKQREEYGKYFNYTVQEIEVEE